MIQCVVPRVTIVGLGLTGRSVLDYFLQCHIQPRLIDSRELSAVQLDIPDGIVSCFGSIPEDWLWESDLIIVSPGIDLHQPIFQQLLQAGKEIIGDIELFARVLAQKTVKKPVVAITGSNGKTTVTTLVGEVCRAANLKMGVGGNIGLPALQLLNHDYQGYILELSSFQLEKTTSLSPTIATVLNVTEDHLDRYPGGMVEYRGAKVAIYRQSETCLFNYDDPLTYPSKETQSKLLSFGIEEGDYHLYKPEGSEYYSLYHQNEFLMASDELHLQGRHNLLNVLVVFAVADCLGIARDITRGVVSQFTGLEHRFQLVLERSGVAWINDSKATNIGSTQAALAGLSCAGRLHLLLGGDGKAADFSELAPYVQGENIRLYCYGRDGKKLLNLNPKQGEYFDSLELAMQKVSQSVTSGDMVLLSPACASWDQFDNYQQRGQWFSELARRLAR